MIHAHAYLPLSLIEPLSRDRSPRNLRYDGRSHCRCLCTSTALCTSPGTLPKWLSQLVLALLVDTCLCDQPQHTRVECVKLSTQIKLDVSSYVIANWISQLLLLDYGIFYSIPNLLTSNAESSNLRKLRA